MASFYDLTTAQLKQAVQIREQIESLQEKLDALLGGAESSSTPKKKVGSTIGKSTMSPATIAKMRAAQQARWAHLKATPEKSTKVTSKKSAPAKVSSTKASPAMAAPKKKVMSPEAKAKIAAAMKARWEAKKKGAKTE